MEFPEELLYTKEHEWARVSSDKKILTIGVTEYAQDKLGDIVHVDLPREGTEVQAEEPFGSLESVKAVSDLFSPVAGKIVEVNDALVDSPEIINEDTYGEGWMIRVEISDPSVLDGMMSMAAYQKFVVAAEEESD